MKTDFLTAMKLVKEDKNMYAEESVNGLEIYQDADGNAGVFSPESMEIYDVPLESILAEWVVYAPLGYKLKSEGRVGSDRCYVMPEAKVIKAPTVSEYEQHEIQLDLERIERNKKLVPNTIIETVVLVLKSGDALPYNSYKTLEQRVKEGEDKLYANVLPISEIWIGGRKGELIYTAKDGFI